MSGLVQVPMMMPPLLREPSEYDERPSYREILMLRRLERRRLLLNTLGIVHLGAVTLPVPGGGTLGPLFLPNGDPVRWSMWAPQKRVLIDVFTKALPNDAEMALRQAFATEHQLVYGVVAPGERLSIERLKEDFG